MNAGEPWNLASCSNELVHRPAVPPACISGLPRAASTCPYPAEEGTIACASDADCTSSPFGHCEVEGSSYCLCNWGCLTDADCGVDSVCLCGDPVGTCVTAACTSDADCNGGFCTAALDPSGAPSFFACTSPDNECEIDADCGPVNYCVLPPGGKNRTCTESSGGGCSAFGSGRPFLVDGAARLAEVAERADWAGSEALPDVAGILAADRRAIAAGWARAGRMEHASIAAFARFTLQLLSLGAPAELVREAQAAMADETAHTRLCFELAGAYAGRPMGPGPLEITSSLDGGSPREILVTAIHEGCVGETVAALEAQEMARRCADPAVRRVLEIIAEDEKRHAELAWRFVKWAIAGDASLASVAASAFEAAALPTATPAEQGEADLSAHGIAGASLRHEIVRHALAEVVAPCARALLRGASALPPQESVDRGSHATITTASA